MDNQIKKLISGDEEAFRSLVLTYQKRVFHHAMQILRNKEEVINSIIEETNEFMMDSLNLIHIKYINPSIFLMIYILILFITIIF